MSSTSSQRTTRMSSARESGEIYRILKHSTGMPCALQWYSVR